MQNQVDRETSFVPCHGGLTSHSFFHSFKLYLVPLALKVYGHVGLSALIAQ